MRQCRMFGWCREKKAIAPLCYPTPDPPINFHTEFANHKNLHCDSMATLEGVKLANSLAASPSHCSLGNPRRPLHSISTAVLGGIVLRVQPAAQSTKLSWLRSPDFSLPPAPLL